ncbi:MAG: hypothetical protein ACI4MH_07225 [Candidatus Coproplasma sp.]
MNYIRKVIALILSLIFCAALVVGAAVILAIRNINVEFINYSSVYLGEYEAIKLNLEKLKGYNLLFLTEDDVKSYVGSSEYIVVDSYEKVFPCSVDVVLKERVETYSVATENGYGVYDEDGVFIRNVRENVNVLDNSPNVLLNVTAEKLSSAVKVCSYFKDKFSSIRNLVKSVDVVDDAIASTLTFNLYSGLKITIIDYDVLTESKMSSVYRVYSSLSESEKLRGVIRAYDNNGELSSVDAAYFA